LIEEDAMVRQALAQVLAVENYRVVLAPNQHEALQEFKSQPHDQPIDLVLLDLNPRNESAWETVERLTALQPNVAVVAMTGRLEEHNKTSTAPVFDALMEKPLNLFLLVRVLNELTAPTPTPKRRRSGLYHSNCAEQSVHNE
jgi:DNA-binding response OmpR family regulator